MKKKELKARFTNKAFLIALAAVVYQILSKYDYAPEFGTYQLYVDLITYALIGSGIYQTFEPKAK